MKFLIDTNIVIPLEPTSPDDAEPTTGPATRFVRLVTENGHQIYLHPASLTDLAKDKSRRRQELRAQLLQKYVQLPCPPAVSRDMTAAIGEAAPGSNEHIDDLMLAALRANAVDWFVTQDIKLHRKAKRLGLSERVLTLLDAIQVIEDLAAKPTKPRPVVESTVAHELDDSDPIFESLRQDYSVGTPQDFDKWLAKCKLEHRKTWLIKGDADGLAAFCIVNQEITPPSPLQGKVLKLCSFKVAERFQGLKYGELLLKTVFEYAFKNGYECLFMTVFERHVELLELIRDFGFEELHPKTALGEVIMAKPLRVPPGTGNELDDLQRHIRFGPHCIRLAEDRVFLVPIQPRYAGILFPEAATQGDLFHKEHPFGSAIRKAYLSHASIRTIEPGSVLIFYRSETSPAIIAVGVVERAIVSNSWEEIARLVARRTVYTLAQIEEISLKKVLVLLFRQAHILDPPLSREEAQRAGVFVKPPQSIMTIKRKGLEWLQEKLNA